MKVDHLPPVAPPPPDSCALLEFASSMLGPTKAKLKTTVPRGFLYCHWPTRWAPKSPSLLEQQEKERDQHVRSTLLSLPRVEISYTVPLPLWRRAGILCSSLVVLHGLRDPQIKVYSRFFELALSSPIFWFWISTAVTRGIVENRPDSGAGLVISLCQWFISWVTLFLSSWNCFYSLMIVRN